MSAENRTPGDGVPVRARHVLRARAVWAFPLILASIVVGIMTAFYMAVIDPWLISRAYRLRYPARAALREEGQS